MHAGDHDKGDDTDHREENAKTRPVLIAPRHTQQREATHHDKRDVNTMAFFNLGSKNQENQHEPKAPTNPSQLAHHPPGREQRSRPLRGSNRSTRHANCRTPRRMTPGSRRTWGKPPSRKVCRNAQYATAPHSGSIDTCGLRSPYALSFDSPDRAGAHDRQWAENGGGGERGAIGEDAIVSIALYAAAQAISYIRSNTSGRRKR